MIANKQILWIDKDERGNTAYKDYHIPTVWHTSEVWSFSAMCCFWQVDSVLSIDGIRSDDFMFVVGAQEDEVVERKLVFVDDGSELDRRW